MAAVACAFSVEGSGPPLLMVHGIGGRRAHWDGVVRALKGDFTCIRYDLRGHGRSPVPPVPYSLDELVEDVEALRGRLGIDRLHIAGHSLGGMIAPAYARTFPERVAALCLVSTAAGRSAEDGARVKGVIAAMEQDGIEAGLGVLAERWFTDAFRARHPEIVEERLEEVLATPAEVFLAVFRIYAATEMLPWLPQIAAPCLVLTGSEDAGCSPRLNRLIHAALPGSELAILEGLRHSLLKEAGAEVAAHIGRFLAARRP